MKYIDMHCDTLLALLTKDSQEADLYQVTGAMVDIERMKKGGQLAQFFAVFLPPREAFERFGAGNLSDEGYIETLRGYLLESVEKHSDIIQMAYNAKDLYHNQEQGKMSAVLTMEDGRAVAGKLENVKRFYEMGFRAISLTWNMANCFSAPNSADPAVMKKGLTDFGKEAVGYMQELGMLVDVSHLSDGGFYDVVKICKKPFVATHSNSRTLCPHQRNLTDDQLRMLSNAGGVAGLNFGPEFLNEDMECRDSTAKRIAEHVRHMVNVGGIDCVGLGSDFDGVTGNLEINDCTKLNLLEEALEKERFSPDEIEKIFYKNVLRVMNDSMK